MSTKQVQQTLSFIQYYSKWLIILNKDISIDSITHKKN